MTRSRLVIVKTFSRIYKLNEQIERHHKLITIFFGVCGMVSLIHFGKEIRDLTQGDHSLTINKIIEIIISTSHLFLAFISLCLFARGVAEPLFYKIKRIKSNWSAVIQNLTNKINAGNYQSAMPVLSPKDIECLAEFSIIAYGAENLDFDQRVIMFSEWYGKRKECISFLYNMENEKIGYACVLPLKSNKHYLGDIKTGETRYAHSQFNIGKDEIAGGMAQYVLIQGIYIEDSYTEDIAMIGELLFEVLKKVALFSDIKNTIVYSEPFFASGEVLCGLLGMYNKYPQKKSHEGHRYYELKLGHDDLPFSIKNNAELTTKLIKDIKMLMAS